MSASGPSSMEFSRFQLPGLNLRLNWTPRESVRSEQGEGKNLFRTALNEADCADGYVSLPMTTLREFAMLHIMNVLTNKPSWEVKVFDDSIAEKWKAEALATPGRDVSQNMVDWVIEELRFKAKIFQQTLAVSVYDGDVVKSDSAVPEYIRESLKASVCSLEDVPGRYKDYHPGSDSKVLDLVHPSLFPLIYGKTRVLNDSLIGIDDCIQSCGKGVVVPVRSDDERLLDSQAKTFSYSKNFQWLPSEVDITTDGHIKLSSYINNLHPQKHQSLYKIVEEVIDRAIPLWNMSLTPLKADCWRFNRISYEEAQYDPDPDDIAEEEGPQQQDNEDDEDFDQRRDDWIQSIVRVVQPEPGVFHLRTVPDHMEDEYFEPNTKELKAEKTVDLKRDYRQRGLQIIVKLANIELTPAKADYEGGTWHVEGQMNEHICATALFYYDNENITDSYLAFRQQSSDDTMDINYGQERHEWLKEVFGCEQNGPTVQEVGSVLCKEGRLLTFPNILQHRVQPFKLADPTKPGHRKILALFLVDPGIRIISTANVPPQRRDWWSESVISSFSKSGKALGLLNPDLQRRVFESIDEFPISMEEAKEIRLRLMEERKKHVVQSAKAFEQHEFSLCEH